MTDLISIGTSAVAAYQRALGTVSNNIANVGTDGYSRQEVVLEAGAAKKEGVLMMGTGVLADRIRRSYDAFTESNLRNSNSDLASKEPMVSYSNRVVDIMGGSTMGLTDALDKFFSSARNLSSDPASIVVRGSFVRDAQGLASRFNELSGQLDLLQSETREAIESNVGQINTLVKQLALVNGQMTKQESVDRQPPQLLDQRDQLLKELSSIARVTTAFKTNGAVSVSLGPSVIRDVILDGTQSVSVGADFNAAAPEKVSLVIDPYGENPAPLTSITSGSIAGLMQFREQVLGSARISLDALATMLSSEVNAVHQAGVDGYGNAGAALFSTDPAATGAAAGLRVAIDDPMLIAAAAQFRVIEDANNTGAADASLVYRPDPPTGPASLMQALLNNPHPSAGLALTLGAVPKAVATIPNGLQDVTIYLDSAKEGQQLQVLTRDGRQLMGQTLDPSTQTLLMTTANGFAAGASYSAAYLNPGSTASSYQNMAVFYGARAEVQQQPVYDSVGQPMGSKPLPATLIGTRMQSGQAIGIAANTLTLNGTALAALAPQTGKTLQAGDTVAWINAVSAQTGITASVRNEVVIAPSQIKINSTIGSLKINGTTITMPGAGVGSARELAVCINASTKSNPAQASDTGVMASIDPDGNLVLSNIAGKEGDDIVIGSAGNIGNVLGIPNATLSGQISLTRNNELRVPTTQLALSRPLVLPRISSNGLPMSESLQLAFTSNSHYTITDLATNKVIGERDYDPATFSTASTNLGLGLDIAFSAVPKVGDKFTLDAKITINPPSGGFASAQALADAIEAQSAKTGVRAQVANGQLVLGNAPAQGLSDIKILNNPNALGVAAASYNSARDKSTGLFPPIQLGFGATGTPADLAKLGFRTGAYISGAAKDDLLVFVSGAGTASVAASYSGKPADAKQTLRGQPMEVVFTSDTHYTITDVKTKTILAERDFDPSKFTTGVSYQGLRISFSNPPKAGNKFSLDGNSDGTGNNENMLGIAAIETKRVFGGKTLFGGTKTLGMAYIEQVNDIGNIARQASIAKASLTVVHDQAVSARDQVSGVSLDEEAADLIRFQQAYQAAAKTIQVSGQIFDTILHIQ